LVICIPSERPGTLAGRKKWMMPKEETKQEDCRKLSIYNKNMLGFASGNSGQTVEVLVEKFQKKSTEEFWKKFAKYYGGFPKIIRVL
jgi:tRNA A37 methylthiotransferase MiaB